MAKKKKSKPEKVEKKRITTYLPVPLIERVKNCVFFTPGLTMAGFAEIAYRAALEKMEKDNGGPFQQRTQELTGGRPLG